MAALEEAVSHLGTQISSNTVASSLGTAADIWVIIALLMPGFITFKIISWLAVYETKKIDQFTATIYSLMLSLVIFVPVSLLFNLRSFTEIRTNVGYPSFIFSLLAFAVLFGFIPGTILRSIRGNHTFEGPWDGFGNEMSGKYVIVRTTDGKEYRGWLKKISQGENKNELSLGNPKFIEYDEGGNPKEIHLGTELLISEPNIHSILRYKE